MNSADLVDDSDELRPEYRREDFGVMTRGKYAERVRQSSNVVVLDADVAEAFPNAQAVNHLFEFANDRQLPDRPVGRAE